MKILRITTSSTNTPLFSKTSLSFSFSVISFSRVYFREEAQRGFVLLSGLVEMKIRCINSIGTGTGAGRKNHDRKYYEMSEEVGRGRGGSEVFGRCMGMIGWWKGMGLRVVGLAAIRG